MGLCCSLSSDAYHKSTRAHPRWRGFEFRVPGFGFNFEMRTKRTMVRALPFDANPGTINTKLAQRPWTMKQQTG